MAKREGKRRAPEPKTSARRLAVAERRRKAIELRLAGLTYPTIYERYPELGYRSPSAIVQDVQRAIDQYVGGAARELVALEAARLERLNQAIWASAMQGDLGSVAEARRLSESRRKLHGLDAADRVGADDADLDLLLQAALGDPGPELDDDEEEA